jgi:hypothetical protein
MGEAEWMLWRGYFEQLHTKRHQGCALSSALPSRGLGGFDGALLVGSVSAISSLYFSISVWSHVLGVWYGTIHGIVPLRLQEGIL